MRPLEDIEADYIQYLRMERNLSTHTVRAYLGDLESFLNHLEMQKVGQISDLTIAHIRSWLATQQVKGGARTTLSRRAVSIRLFTKWATKNGYLSKDVGATLATPKGHRTLPEVLTVSDASIAMDSLATRVAEEETPLSKRDCAILEVLYASGARVSELCGRDLDDVEYNRNTIRVLGKGNKERTIPLGGPAITKI
jgi:integrase/recombinase XerC